MASNLLISKLLLESTVAKLENFVALKEATQNLEKAKTSLEELYFFTSPITNDPEVEKVNQLLQKARILLNNKGDFDENEANNIRRQIELFLDNEQTVEDNILYVPK